MDEQEELHTLGHIQVDPRPRPLGIDKMFLRARNWQYGAGPSAPVRPASPPPTDAPLALPAPLTEKQGDTSPLAGVFAYPELAPLVLEQLFKPAELAIAARVCKTWARVARRRLYKEVWVRPWEAAPKEKLLGLFATLCSNRELCAMVHSLDVRFFPLDMQGDLRVALEDAVQMALKQMSNLRRLEWTRDRSLSTELFTAIAALPQLASLELTGHSTHHFDPTVIGSMPALRDLRIMMPDSEFCRVLPGIIKELDRRVNGGLSGLALVCKTQNNINDTMLKAIAPNLTSLERLTFIGQTRMTKVGMYELLESTAGLKELSMDSTLHSDLVDLSDAPDLPCLCSFALSFPAPHHSAIMSPEDMPLLRRNSNLRALELTVSSTTAEFSRRILPLATFTSFVTQLDFSRLTRIALLNLVLSSDTLAALLAASPALEELYISVFGAHTLSECSALIGSPLQVLHANAAEGSVPTREQLGELAVAMPKIQQIGSQNRVYEVHRRYVDDERVVQLARWSQTYIPGYFQVWRP